MNIAEDIAYEYAKENGTIGVDYDQIYAAVIHGYEQAKATKPKALTWQDIEEIWHIIINTGEQHGPFLSGQPFYEEVLRRFNKQ